MWPKTFGVAPTSVNVWTWKQINAFRNKKKFTKKGENQEVYYFRSVFFFTVPSTSWETDHFLPLTVGVRQATHNLCMWIHSVYSVYTHSQIRTFIWMSARSPHLLQTLSLGRITPIHFLLKPQLLSATNSALQQFRMIPSAILKQTKVKGNHLSSRLLLLFPPQKSFLLLNSSSPPSSLHFPLPRMPCVRRRSGLWSWRRRCERTWTRQHIGRLCGRRRRLPTFRPRDRFTWCYTHLQRTPRKPADANTHLYTQEGSSSSILV